MLGKAFFQLLHDLESSDSFDRVVGVLERGLGPLLGSHSCFVLEILQGTKLHRIHGTTETAQRLREQCEELDRVLLSHPLNQCLDLSQSEELGQFLRDYLSPEACQDSELNRICEGEFRISDGMFGRLFSCCRRQVLLVACVDQGSFSLRQREAFDVILLMARAVLGRIAGLGIESAVRHYLMRSAGYPVAVFAIQPDRRVIPLSHGAVRYAEVTWSVDEATRTLDTATHEAMRQDLGVAWEDPVTAVLEPVKLDLGAGEKTCHALPKADGEILVFLPLTGGLPSGDEALKAILTRRQREIMEWIVEGKTSAEAAEKLYISRRTVEKHLEAVFHRLGVKNRAGAVRRYLDLKSGQAT